ncbi:MAG: methylmalonyl Co-A mutase-associated GTPase MeaB [Pseudomonadota bacterium]
MSEIATADRSMDVDALAARIAKGDRRALARGITLVESTRGDHRAAAVDLVDRLLSRTGQSTRVGITGVPGVGKSTFIEAFGQHVIGEGHRLAVLAIDPTSKRSGGSILGDKTRMEELARSPDAFIRPSPAGATLGGVARRTREAMLLCEAAGFDVILVETVGVGQSETAVADMVDMFLLLLVPGGGDELQGIKKGIVELADLLVVNKADGDLKAAAGRAAGEYQHALHLLTPSSPHWSPEVQQCSALTRTGIAPVWETITRFRETMTAVGAFDTRRAEQAKAWMWSEISDTLLADFQENDAVGDAVTRLETDVASGKTAPAQAARTLIDLFLSRP